MATKKVDEHVGAKVSAKLRSLIDEIRPGMVECAVGGHIQEINGIPALVGAQIRQIPLTQEGLPEVQEVLRKGWTSKRGTKVSASEMGTGSALLGKYRVPFLVNGVTRYVEGALMAFGRPTPHFTFSTANQVKYPTTVQVGGKDVIQEKVSYIPIFGAGVEDVRWRNIQAEDRTLDDLLGQVVAHQMGIEIV
jgi:hypothetical protein